MHKTQHGQQRSESLRRNVELSEFCGVLKVDPALVAQERYADVSEQNPKDDTQAETSYCRVFVNSVGEHSGACRADVTQRVQPGDQEAWPDEILQNHSAVECQCDKVVQVHFPEVWGVLSEENMVDEILNEVAHLEKR